MIYYSKVNLSFIIFATLQQRHRSDNQVNNRRSLVFRNGKLVEERWHKVVVGDIIRMENNQFVAVSPAFDTASHEKINPCRDS